MGHLAQYSLVRKITPKLNLFLSNLTTYKTQVYLQKYKNKYLALNKEKFKMSNHPIENYQVKEAEKYNP